MIPYRLALVAAAVLVVAGCGDEDSAPAADAPHASLGDYACHDGDACEFPLVVGTGAQSGEYEALAPGSDIELIHGSQGGYHIWIALRCRDCPRQMLVHYGVKDGASGAWSYLDEPILGLVTFDDGPDGWRERTGLFGFVSGPEVAGRPMIIDVLAETDEGREAAARIEVVPGEPAYWDCEEYDPASCAQ